MTKIVPFKGMMRGRYSHSQARKPDPSRQNGVVATGSDDAIRRVYWIRKGSVELLMFEEGAVATVLGGMFFTCSIRIPRTPI